MTVQLSCPVQMERRINVKAISPTTAFTSAFEEFQKSITKESQILNTAKYSCYNLRSQSKEGEGTKY